MENSRQLTRSRAGVLGGVCAGIADYFSTDALTVRVLAVLLVVVTCGLVVLPYVVLWAVLPKAPDSNQAVDVQPNEVSSETFGCVNSPRPPWEAPKTRVQAETPEEARRRIIVVLMLCVGAGVLFYIIETLVSHYVRGVSSWQCLPLLLIIAGIMRMIVPGPGGYALAPFVAGLALFVVGAVLLFIFISPSNEVVLNAPYGKQYWLKLHP